MIEESLQGKWVLFCFVLFCFVNDNISECEHRLHLLETGKYILANNFMNGINNYFSLKYRQNNHFRHKIQTRVLIP